MQTVGERIEWVRELAGISSREVGRLSGLAETHIRAIETRTGIRAQAETLERIAAALGCDPAWLLFGKGEPPTVETVLAAVEEGRARLTNAEVAS